MLTGLRAALKARQESTQPVVRIMVAGARRAWHAAIAVRSFITDADGSRSATLLKFRYRADVHQTTSLTWLDRYPVLFAASREFLGDRPELRILSYGCSTGEEVLTLRKYFPQARIVGAEINRKSLKRARALPFDDRVSFVHSSRRNLAKHAPYDAIFCMAVLQRTPHLVEAQDLKTLAGIYPFERFDEQLTMFDSWLKPGGLLVVHHAQYLVEHASVAKHYHALDGVPSTPDSGTKFGPDSVRIEAPAAIRSIHVKASGAITR